MSTESESIPALPRTVQWAAAWLMILCSLYAVNAFAALVGLRVYAFTLPLCLILSLVGVYWLAKLEGRPVSKRLLTLMGVVFMAAVLVFGYGMTLIWEYSYWGRGFYTEAIAQLAGGWKPVYDGGNGVSELVYRSRKALWYVDASLYAFLGHYEMVKAHTLLFAVPTFLLTRHCFGRLLEGKYGRIATLTALLSLFNPVALSQMFSLYGDAVLAYAIQCFLLLGYLIVNEGYLHSDLLMVQALLWIFILHFQSGGLTAALVLGAGFFIMVAVLYKIQAVRWLAIRASLVLLFGFVILGFNPFLQNLLDTGTPFLTTNLTADFRPVTVEGYVGLGQFIYSCLASPDTGSLNLNILLQQLTALLNTAYAAPDVRLRGFGLIGGLLILASGVLVVVALLAPRHKGPDDNAIYISEEGEEEAAPPSDYVCRRTALLWLVLPVLAIALFSGSLWWARSVAILWFLIPLAVIALCTRRNDGRSGVARLLLLLAFANGALMLVSIVPTAIAESNTLQGYWQRMNTADDLPSDEDAQLHNQFVNDFDAWNALKGGGEEAQAEHAIWTKIERIIL